MTDDQNRTSMPAPIPPGALSQSKSPSSSPSSEPVSGNEQPQTQQNQPPQQQEAVADQQSSQTPTPPEETLEEAGLNTEMFPQIPEHIVRFLFGVLKEGGMGDLDTEKQAEMIRQLFMRLDDHLITVLAEELDDAQIEEFIRMNKEGSAPDEIQTFLQKNIENVDQKMAKAFVEFRNMYVNTTALMSDDEEAPQTEAPTQE